jgi:hypothetical protein
MIQGTSILCIGTSVGKTFAFQDGLYSDDGNAIAVRVKTKNYYPQPVDLDKQLQYVAIFSDQPQGANFSVSLDDGDYDFRGQIQGDKDPNEFKIWRSAKKCSFGLDEVSTNNIQIKGFLIYYA